MQGQNGKPDFNERKNAGEIAYLRAIANIKHLLSEHDLEFLYAQRTAGIDRKGRIIIKQEENARSEQPDHSRTLQLVSRQLLNSDWATGLRVDYVAPKKGSSSQFRKLLFLPRFLVNMTLPHKSVQGNEFSRRNGTQQLSMLAPRSVGLPYGSYARLILMYLTTKRVTLKEREFLLGESWRDFLKLMQVPWSGGKNSGRRAIQNQLKRLSSTLYTLHIAGEDRETISNVVMADQWMKTEDGVSIALSESFYNLSGESVVPLEPTIVHKLRGSPLMLDLYPWLTYRAVTLKRETTIPWRLLELQFGADYRRARDFRTAFRRALATVLKHRPVTPQVNLVPKGLHLEPASPADADWAERLSLIAKARSL